MSNNTNTQDKIAYTVAFADGTTEQIEAPNKSAARKAAGRRAVKRNTSIEQIEVAAEWDVLSTDEAADMSEVFEAEALGAEAVADLEAHIAEAAEEAEVAVEAQAVDAHAEYVERIRAAVAASDKKARNEAIRAGHAAGMTLKALRAASGLSAVGRIVEPKKTARKVALTKHQQGYQEALADIAAQLEFYGDSVGTVREWIANNRSADADAIFERARAEHAA